MTVYLRCDVCEKLELLKSSSSNFLKCTEGWNFEFVLNRLMCFCSEKCQKDYEVLRQ